MAQNRTPDDRQIRIGTHKIVWELLYKVKQLAEGIMFNFHRHMLTIEYNTMLVVVNIGRVLESPIISLNGNRNDTVILAGRMIQSACIAFIFHTELTFRI